MSNHQRNILLIDEDEIDTMVTAQMLSDADSSYRVISCECLSHAVEALQSELDIDVVIMDLVLPDGTGQRAIDEIARHAADLPMIVLSSWDTPFLRKLRATRVASFLQKKSLSLRVLRESIDHAIEVHSPAGIDVESNQPETGTCDHPLHMHLKSRESGHQEDCQTMAHGSKPNHTAGELEVIQSLSSRF